jgi:hypothetical protein
VAMTPNSDPLSVRLPLLVLVGMPGRWQEATASAHPLVLTATSSVAAPLSALPSSYCTRAKNGRRKDGGRCCECS